MDKAKKKRASHRRNVTKLEGKVNDMIGESAEGINVMKLKHFQRELEEERIDLKELHNEILELLCDEADNDVIDNERDEASNYNEKITTALIRIEEALENGRTEQREQSVSTSGGNIEPVPSRGSAAGKGVNVRLPKLELTKFGGQIHRWQEFWDGYSSAVHENENLAKADKFKYLKSLLEEPAKSVVAGLPLTSNNYETAVKLLKDRYGDPVIIQRAHINQLAYLPPVFSDKNLKRLRELHDQIETHYRGLEALHVDQITYSTIVVPMLMEKIPDGVKFNMIRGTEKKQINWGIEDLLEALAKELEVRESHGSLLQTVGQEKATRPRREEVPPTASSLLVDGRHNGRRKCVYCWEEHAPENCSNVRDVSERKGILSKYARCFVCLKSNHRAFECRSRLPCKRCNGRHHISICVAHIPDAKESQPQQSHQPDAMPSPSTSLLNANAPSWVGSTVSGDRVALQTALAKVNAKKESKVRVLFDTGSHRSFISAKVVSKLGLRPVRSEQLGIKPFGSVNAEYRMRDIVEVSLYSLSGNNCLKIECVVVEDIANISNCHAEIAKKKYPHLHNIWFSDVCRSVDALCVDVLIGSDWLWEFHQGETRRGGPGEPVAVKTKLGWVLSGPLKFEGKSFNSPEDSTVNFLPHVSQHPRILSVEENVNRLWDLDTLGIRQENEVHEAVIDDIRFTGSRYSVGLPWKVGHDKLPSNYANCLLRSQAQVRKFKKDPQTFDECDKMVDVQVEKGIIEEVGQERRKAHVLAAVVEEPQDINQIIDVNKYSKLGKLLRVTAYVLRFIRNVKDKKSGSELSHGRLSVSEIRQAEKHWIRQTQKTLRNDRNFGKIASQLNIVEMEGILVCKGRFDNLDMPIESKYPIYLPKEHKLTELIITDCHVRAHHCGVKGTLAELRSRFWVSKGRQYVKEILRKCFVCRRVEGKPFCEPPTAPLPEYRVSEVPPFSNVGVDFAGPLYIKDTKGKVAKSYICLFSCCVTRALHLEIVHDLSAPTFINCLRRFCARRGTPCLINSDNAKTFKSTAALLKKLAKDPIVLDFLETKRIDWKFNLELSPWQGGHFERLIGCVKRCLRKVLGNAKLSFDELSTVVTEVEATLNSRPLTYHYSEIGEEVLTPSHLLVGRRLTPLSTGFANYSSFDDKDPHSNLSKRFLYLTRTVNHFWSRWRREYIADLRETHRMKNRKAIEVKPGDVVLIHDENTRRGMWKTGIIEETIRGKDRQVRGAKIRKMGKGKPEFINRPLQKLVPLEITREVCQEIENGEERKGEMERNEQEEGQREDNEKEGKGRPSRAAAKDARWRTRLILDS